MVQIKNFTHRHRTVFFFTVVILVVLLASILAYRMVRRDPPTEPWREEVFSSVVFNLYYCRMTPGLFEAYALPDADYPQGDKNPEHYIGVACTVSYDRGTLPSKCSLSITNQRYGEKFDQLAVYDEWFQTADLLNDLLLNITDPYTYSEKGIYYIGDATDEEIEESLQDSTCKVYLQKDGEKYYTYPSSPAIHAITRLTPLVD